jgi:hypothetical protein
LRCASLARHQETHASTRSHETSGPKVALTAPNYDPNLDLTPNFASDVSGEESKITKDAKDFEFYPIVKIGVSYSF